MLWVCECRQTQPIFHMELVQDSGKELFWLELSSTNLKEVQVSINHRVAEVALNVGHGLSFNLQAIPNPQPTDDFIECRL